MLLQPAGKQRRRLRDRLDLEQNRQDIVGELPSPQQRIDMKNRRIRIVRPGRFDDQILLGRCVAPPQLVQRFCERLPPCGRQIALRLGRKKQIQLGLVQRLPGKQAPQFGGDLRSGPRIGRAQQFPRRLAPNALTGLLRERKNGQPQKRRENRYRRSDTHH